MISTARASAFRPVVALVCLLGLPAALVAGAGASTDEAADRVYAWGSNADGQLGRPAGSTADPSPEPPVDFSGKGTVVSVAAGDGHSLALIDPDRNGDCEGSAVNETSCEVWAWGRNDEGQLGSGGTPQPLGQNNLSYCAKDYAPFGRQIGEAYDSAAEKAAEVGQDPPENPLENCVPREMVPEEIDPEGQRPTDSTVPVRVCAPAPAQCPGSFLTNIRSISAGALHSVALDNDGNAWAWGSSTCGQLGDPRTHLTPFDTIGEARPHQVTGLTDVVAIDAGAGHNLALKSDGSLWSWGNNSWGQLGNGVDPNRTVNCGYRGSSGLETGIGQRQVAPGPVLLGGKVLAFSAGGDHSLALTTEATVWSWGNNCNGQLGIDPSNSALTGHRGVPLPVRGLSGLGGGPADDRVVAVSAGGGFSSGHSLALTESGSVFAWGMADILGRGAGPEPAVESPCDAEFRRMNSVGFARPLTGVRSLSEPMRPQPALVKTGDGGPLAGIVSIEAGTFHGMAIDSSGRLFGWGRNDFGQLGRQGGTATSAVVIRSDSTAGARGEKHVLAVPGRPPVRPQPAYTDTLIVPPPVPADPDDIIPDDDPTRVIPEDPYSEVKKELKQRGIDPDDPIPETSLPAPEKPALPRVDPPVAGTGGGVFISAHNVSRNINDGGCQLDPPRTRCNTAGAKHFVRRAVAYVTPGKTAPRLLFIRPQFDETSGDLKGPGFRRGCPAPGIPVAPPGCFDVSWTAHEEEWGEWVACPAYEAGCPSDWRPDNYVDSVRFNAYDAVVVGGPLAMGWRNVYGPVADSEPQPRSGNYLRQRRHELAEYVNRGGGLVLLGQLGSYAEDMLPYPDECRSTLGPGMPHLYQVNSQRVCDRGFFLFLDFIDDRPYSEPESLIQKAHPTDFYSSTEHGRQLGLTDEDLNEHKRPGARWIFESCGFDVMETDLFGRITSMATRKKIPFETKCSGAAATEPEVLEGNTATTALEFDIRLNSLESQGGVGAQIVRFETVDQTATAGDNDYLPVSGTLEFSRTEAETKRVVVQVVGDEKPESDEKVGLKLTTPESSEISMVTGRIINDDHPSGAEEADDGSGQSAGALSGSSSNSQAGPPPSSSVPASAVPAPVAAQGIAQIQLPAQAQGQAQSQAQGQAQVQAQSPAQAPQVGLMAEKQKQEQIERAFSDNELVPAELLASSRNQGPVTPVVVMALSVITALAAGVFRRASGRAVERVPDLLERAQFPAGSGLWLRRKRRQR